MNEKTLAQSEANRAAKDWWEGLTWEERIAAHRQATLTPVAPKATNVVNLPVITRLDLPPERVLASAAELEFERVTVIGVTADGFEYFAASAADGGSSLWDMERAKMHLLTIGENNG